MRVRDKEENKGDKWRDKVEAKEQTLSDAIQTELNQWLSIIHALCRTNK